MNRQQMISKIWREEYMRKCKVTVEEMIAEIETQVYSHMPCYGMDDDIGDAVIAALRRLERLERAGQTLYEEKMFDIIWERGRCDNDTRSPGMQAWDAASGEKE